MGKLASMLHGFKPVLIMILVQTIFAAANVGYKLGTNDGMTSSILVAYRFLFAAAFMVPLSLYVERKKRPKMTWTVLGQSFCCGLLGGSFAQNLFLLSMVMTSATFTVAMTNLIPAITFILALAFRLEKLVWNTMAGKAKVLGTLIGITGAMTLTFYKGPEINLTTNVNLLNHPEPQSTHSHLTSKKMAIGFIYAFASCISYALWLILQAKMAKKYPCPYSSTALMNVFAAIQGVVYALCVTKNWDDWKLGWNIRLLVVSYTGIVGSGLMFTLIAWCVQMRGPLFVSVFNPLMLVMVAIAGTLFLDEKLHLGSIIGAITIVCGLYVVLWGKSKEAKRAAQLVPERINTGNNTTDNDPKEIVVVPSSAEYDISDRHVIPSSTENNTSDRHVIPSSTENNISDRLVIPSSPENNTSDRHVIPSSTENNISDRHVISSSVENNTSDRHVIPSSAENNTSDRHVIPSSTNNTSDRHIIPSATDNDITDIRVIPSSTENDISHRGG